MVLTPAERQARYRARRRAEGHGQCVVFAPDRWHRLIEDFAAALRNTASLPATEFLIYWRDPKGRVHPLKELVG